MQSRPTIWTINIELQPDEERALSTCPGERQDAAQYVQKLIRDDIQAVRRSSSQEDAPAAGPAALYPLIDHEFVAECEREIEGKAIPTIEEVRLMLSKIPGSLAQEIIAEREDRF